MGRLAGLPGGSLGLAGTRRWIPSLSSGGGSPAGRGGGRAACGHAGRDKGDANCEHIPPQGARPLPSASTVRGGPEVRQDEALC